MTMQAAKTASSARLAARRRTRQRLGALLLALLFVIGCVAEADARRRRRRRRKRARPSGPEVVLLSVAGAQARRAYRGLYRGLRRRVRLVGRRKFFRAVKKLGVDPTSKGGLAAACDKAGCKFVVRGVVKRARRRRYELTISVTHAATGSSVGLTSGPGSFAHWPGGLVAAFPAAHCVNGTVVLAPGDLNLTFNDLIQTPVRLTIEDDHIVRIEGDGADAALFDSYLSAFGDRESYATSHVGWGMNQHARWDSAQLYDKRETWGTEARVYAGNFVYSTGANEPAGRFTAGHFDLPMRNCTITLDDRTVVDHGRLCAELAPPR